MKLTKLFMMAAVAVLGVNATQAEMGNFGDRFRYDRDSMEKFGDKEFNFDAFGTYQAGERKFSSFPNTNIRHGKFGGGVGLNYFFCKNVGVGSDINIGDNGGNFVDSLSASLIARFPIEQVGLAPYVFAGGGRQFDPAWVWSAHVGGGLEFRLNHHTGIFSDARYVFADKIQDYVLLRAGVRLGF